MIDKSTPLFFDDFGTGLPVIFLHGYPLNHTIWTLLVEGLKETARLILPDLRGHGKSPAPDGAYSMSLMAADILALMDSLKIEKAIIIGHSMGGYATLTFAKLYPERLAGLGLVATQAAPDPPDKRQARLDSIQQVKSLGVAPIVEAMLPRLTSRSELFEPLRSIMLQTNPQGVIGILMGMADREDATPWLSSIHVPSLIIAGLADAIIPLGRAHDMARLIPNAWLVEIPDIGHMPMMDMPEKVTESCLELIKTVKAKGTAE